MKVKIGPYLEWWGPYQIADLLQYLGVSKKHCVNVGNWLANTRFNDLCEAIHERRKRKVSVKIDPYDTWSMDHTLALIIVPMLKQLKECSHGAPGVDLEDVPESLRNSNPNYDIDGSVDDKWFDRWNWVLDEMIFAFEQTVEDDIRDKETNNRVNNGLRLFGKYYRSLWD